MCAPRRPGQLHVCGDVYKRHTYTQCSLYADDATRTRTFPDFEAGLYTISSTSALDSLGIEPSYSALQAGAMTTLAHCPICPSRGGNSSDLPLLGHRRRRRDLLALKQGALFGLVGVTVTFAALLVRLAALHDPFDLRPTRGALVLEDGHDGLSFTPRGRPRRGSNPPHTLDKRAASTRCVRGLCEIKCAFAALLQTLFCTEADNRTRTGDLVDGNHVLYQLSYVCEGYVTGLEPAAAGSTNQCSTIELHTPHGRLEDRTQTSSLSGWRPQPNRRDARESTRTGNRTPVPRMRGEKLHR